MSTREHLPVPALPLLVCQLLPLELAKHGRRLARAIGLRRPPPLDPEELAPPDSALARRAEELLRGCSPDYLVHHCRRTYAFGLALGKAFGQRPDRELLFVASALHDLGLTETHQGPEPFELRGAHAAHRFCLEEGMPPERAERVHEAIALHTSLAAAKREPEIALVHFGAGADVIGYRWQDLAKQTVEQVLSEWPRLDFKTAILRDLGREAERTPDSPLGVQWRLGFAQRVRSAPFAE